MSKTVNIFWFRRDLRLDDNVGFHEALKGDYPVLPLFIFDSEILVFYIFPVKIDQFDQTLLILTIKNGKF